MYGPYNIIGNLKAKIVKSFPDDLISDTILHTTISLKTAPIKYPDKHLF